MTSAISSRPSKWFPARSSAHPHEGERCATRNRQRAARAELHEVLREQHIESPIECNAHVLLRDVRVKANRFAHEVVHRSDRLDAGKAAARNENREQRTSFLETALEVRLLQLCDKLIAQLDGVAE
jgi:hypothetical protein